MWTLTLPQIATDAPCSYFFFDELFLEEDLLDDDFLDGTFAPARRASDSPMAIACLRLFTFLPERPLLSFPFFRSCIALSTFSDAFFPYLAIVPPYNEFL
jgi:hypothetical protein